MPTLNPQASAGGLQSAKPTEKVAVPPVRYVSDKTIRKPAEIRFVRSRMFYAKPSVNAKGDVRLGMRHIRMYLVVSLAWPRLILVDVLNRRSDINNEKETVHVMKYIFPRQFRLHNVFSCKIDYRQTAQPFKDYTLREAEIQSTPNDVEREHCTTSNEAKPPALRLPKRLRGRIVELISTLRKRHQKCSYVELLRYYCPVLVCLLNLSNCLKSKEDY
jgi:telomerase reverse transcriptase